ncbi:MAG: hypothetical protein PF541_07620 [Prolixibacteraceae bacterium]|jgi:hypothetical protein|nr:hypothetical protein [Prolixibacteraceae bacterium]
MKKLIFIPVLLISLFIFYACPFGNSKKYYPNAWFPTEIINLESVNSSYDDINMDLPFITSDHLLLFASNRNSRGEQFDLISRFISFDWSKTSGKFYEVLDRSYEFQHLDYLLTQTKTSFDEYGPYSFFYNGNFYLLYSSNKKGTNDVQFIFYDKPYEHRFDEIAADSVIKGPIEIPCLSNPNFNEGYVSIHTSHPPFDELNIYNPDIDLFSLVFSSDSLGTMDIYSIPLNNKSLSYEFLSSLNTEEIQLITTVNSEYNDRCPNVNGNFMVFSSDRPGGLGGYDFYYSIFENDAWSEPVNFGAPINSEFDEYRAIASKAHGYNNDLLLFSSNRPGGIGGFDIYYTGIDLIPD